MKITSSQFYEFWTSQHEMNIKKNNAERLYENITDVIERYNDSLALDDYVTGLRSGKESTRRLIVRFYKYIGVPEDETELYNMKFYDYPIERQLEIAKYLHTERTAAEIEHHFSIDKRTRQADLQALESGIEIFGTTIKIEKERKKGKYYYRSTLHPVFLPLNLTEVYAVTIYLERIISRGDANAEILHNIANRIKSQLSDYAYEKLYEEPKPEYMNNYRSDESLAHQREGIAMYLMKSGRSCRFFYKNNEYTGKIQFINGKYHVVLNDGQILDADISEVDFIPDSFEYL